MLTERPSVYLASKSPRRQELLRQIGVEFEELLLREAPGRRRDIVEVPRKDEAPFEYVKRVARTKAAVGWHRMGRRELPPKPVLAADTEVVVDGVVLGKPDDAADAAVDAGAIVGPHARRRDRRGDPLERADRARHVGVARELPRHRCATRSSATLRPASRSTRPGPTRSRDAPRPLSAASRAATRV